MVGSGRPLGRLLNFTAANRYLSLRVGVQRRLAASSSHARIAGSRPLLYSGVIDRFFIAAYRYLLNFTAANRYLSIRVGVERRLTASSSHARIAGCWPLLYSGVIDRFFIAAYRSLCFRV